jgi:hypothetical protein
MGVRGCFPARGEVAIVNILAADVPPSCTSVEPRDLLLVINRTGAYDRSDARPLTVKLGAYSARLDPEQAALFARPTGSYLALGSHSIHAGTNAGGPGIQVLPRDCRVVQGHLPNSCFR